MNILFKFLKKILFVTSVSKPIKKTIKITSSKEFAEKVCYKVINVMKIVMVIITAVAFWM